MSQLTTVIRTSAPTVAARAICYAAAQVIWMLRRLLAFLLVLTAGCAGPVTALPDDIRSLVLTAEAGAVLQLAETVLIARCMRDAGLGYPLDLAAIRQELLAAPTTPAPTFAWPQDDENHATGNDLASAEQPQRPRTDLERHISELDPDRRQAFTLALHGDPTTGPWVHVTLPGGATVRQNPTGCTSQAQRRLYGDLDAYLRARITADNLNPLVLTRVTTDPAFLAAERRWRTCMAQHGWLVAHHGELAARVAETAATLASGAQARRRQSAAVLAARCNRQAGLSATARRLTPAADRRIRADLAPLLADLSRREQAALPYARRLLSGEDS